MHRSGMPLAQEMAAKLFPLFNLIVSCLFAGCDGSPVVGPVIDDPSTTLSWEISEIDARATKEFTETPANCFQYYGTISSQSILFSDNSSTGTLNVNCPKVKQKPLSAKMTRSQASWDRNRSSGPTQLSQVWMFFYKDTPSRKSEVVTFTRASTLADFEQTTLHFSGVCQSPAEPGAYIAQLVLATALDEGRIYEGVNYIRTVIDEVKFTIEE